MCHETWRLGGEQGFMILPGFCVLICVFSALIAATLFPGGSHTMRMTLSKPDNSVKHHNIGATP